MGRRGVNADEEISLFPFLSVVACMIGTLTLIIAALSISGLDNDTVERALEYEEVKGKFDSELLAIAELKNMIVDKREELGLSDAEKNIKAEELTKQLAALLEQKDAARKEFAETTKLEIRPVNIKQQTESIDQMQEELKGHQEQIAQLDKQISERDIELTESQVSILPSGSGVGFIPKFVECAASQVIIHSAPEPILIRVNELAANADYKKLMDSVSASEKTTLVFLIRDDGLNTYYTARNLANTNGVKNGKLPVIGKGRIDLSYFNKKK
ncbi:MAG: hypothetical protein COA78_08860 [Blastopirellula sp.]|nr:MAG: hypothetical protein COA78_08860 [Blastopirellula sp.]